MPGSASSALCALTPQVWVGVAPVGPSGHALNSSYNTRHEDGYKRDLGMALTNWARVVPDGLLVFFPSYRVLEMCVDFWKGCANLTASAREFRGTLWDDITKTKQAVIEPKVSSDCCLGSMQSLPALHNSTHRHQGALPARPY